MGGEPTLRGDAFFHCNKFEPYKATKSTKKLFLLNRWRLSLAANSLPIRTGVRPKNVQICCQSKPESSPKIFKFCNSSVKFPVPLCVLFKGAGIRARFWDRNPGLILDRLSDKWCRNPGSKLDRFPGSELVRFPGSKLARRR